MSESESLSPNIECLPPREPTPDITFEDAARGLHLPKRRKARRYTDRGLLPEHRQSKPKKKIPSTPSKPKRAIKPGEFKFKGGKIHVAPAGFVLTFRLTGMQFYNADGTSRSRLLQECSPQTAIFIRRETDNLHDPNAIAVCESASGRQLGFIPKEIAAVVAKHTDDGSFHEPKARIEKMLGFSYEPGARIRVDFILRRKIGNSAPTQASAKRTGGIYV